jgi:hypothetical protein
MGFRYQKRINVGNGVGLNLSKSGVSTSYRTKYGSIGPKGFSIRTGIPGLTFRSKKSGDAAVIMFALVVIAFGALVAWNLFLFVMWASKETYHFVLRKKMEYESKKSAPTP